MIVNKPVKKKKTSRYTVFLIIMGIIFAAIIMKLLYLQVYKHEDYKERADTTSTKFVSEKAPRGKIYDQDGNILATNTQTFSLTYTSTDEANKQFYKTMDMIYEILLENNEIIQDDLPIIIDENNEFAFKYSTTTEASKRIEEIRFKRDRGLNESIELKLFGEDHADLYDEDIEKVNDELMKITPEEFFHYLVKSYGIINVTEPTDEELKKYKADKEITGEKLTEIIVEAGYSHKEIRKYLVIKDAIKIQSIKGFKSVNIASNINKDTAFIIEQKSNDLPGINVTIEPSRYYPYGEFGSSFLGYISKIDSSKKEKYELRGYDVSSDLIGVSGIEASFEEQLKGVKGGTTVKVNSTGKTTEELFKLESYPGNNIHLTIDKDVQYAMEQSLNDTMQEIVNKKDWNQASFKNATRGAAIAVEVKTGRILGLASNPGFDPNMFAVSGSLTPEQTKEYFNPDYEAFGTELIQRMGLDKTVDDLFPKDSNGNRQDTYDLYPRSFYNYATQGLLPPGSIFKPLTAVAGIEEGVIGVNETVYDAGIFAPPGLFTTANGPQCLIYTTNRDTHGAVDVRKALEVSCNYYFYEIAYRLYQNSGESIESLDVIAEYAWKFGLGVDPDGKQEKSTGIEIEENFGQTFNFKSFRQQQVDYARFKLSEELEKGNYEGMYSFVPFDFAYRDEDTEKVAEAKKSLKSKVTDALMKVGTPEEIRNHTDYSKSLWDEVKYIMENSEKYKANVASAGGNVDINKQAKIVCDAIAQFVVNDKATEIKSAAQLIYSSIGQGMNNFTPIQLASYISTLANGGTRYSLHLVDRVTTPDGEVTQVFEPEVLDTIDISKETMDAIKEGMKRANNDDGGTAYQIFKDFPIESGGKTGTADFKKDQGEIGRAPYATYVSFAPLDDPEIAFIGVIYDGGHGSWTAPVAKAAYEAYFKERLLEIDPDYASKSESFTKYVVNGAPDNKDSK